MYNDYYNSSAMSGFLTAYGIFMIALLIVVIVGVFVAPLVFNKLENRNR